MATQRGKGRGDVRPRGGRRPVALGIVVEVRWREVRGDPDGWVPPGSERERVEVGWTGSALLG